MSLLSRTCVVSALHNTTRKASGCSVRSVCLFVVSILLSMTVIAQNDAPSGDGSRAQKVSILWQNVEEIRIDEEEFFRRLAFQNAVFNDDLMLPQWHTIVEHARTGTRIEASISDLLTAPLTSQEIQVVREIRAIGSEFELRVNPVVVRKELSTSVFITPIRRAGSGTFEKLVSFTLNIREVSDTRRLPTLRKGRGPSVLANGDWHRVRVSRDGIYRIDYTQLQSMGLSGAGASNIQVYGMGGAMLPERGGAQRPDGLQQIAIMVVDGGDNRIDPGDYILFYGEGPGEWIYDSVNNRFNFAPHLYDDHNYYYVTRGNTAGLRIQNQSPAGGSPTHTVTTFRDHYRYETDSINLIKSGKLWLGEVFDLKTTYQFNFPFSGIEPSNPIDLVVSVVARSLAASSFTVQSGSQSGVIPVPAIFAGYQNQYANHAARIFSFNISGNEIPLTINYQKPLSSSTGWLDYLQINLERTLQFSGNQLRFRQPGVTGSGNIARYQIDQGVPGMMVWDVTNPLVPESVQGTLSGSVFTFDSDASVLKQFTALRNSGFYAVEGVTKVNNQDLRSTPPTDMVIVSHPNFLASAERLANIHRTRSGLTVLVVTPEKLYNDFSSGKQDPAAIRDFMKMLYDQAVNAKELPKYLLLFGDGSYDNKGRAANNTNFIPTFQSVESLHPAYTFVTDDFFGMLDDHEGVNSDGALDIGIGRIPVATSTEAVQMVDKIERYLSDNSAVPNGNVCGGTAGARPLADWRNTICLVADDEDGNLHVDQAEILTVFLDANYPVYNINKVYIDAYQQISISGGHRYPDVNDAINRQVERGALIMNYIGHGGELGWAHERILRIDDINSWTNRWQMPLFLTSTCEFSRFDDPGRRSAGEYVYLNPSGGAIAMFTTTRLAFASTNYAFNTAFYQHVLARDNGAYQRLGDIFMKSKIGSGSVTSNRQVVILGDPALTLAYPKYNVVTTHINDSLVSGNIDTLKALSKITVKGMVTDQNGQIIHGFNGILYPVVYDKKLTFTTQANDQGSYPKNFWMQKNALYKGKVSVTNGHFEFSFVVPKDIAYAFGYGKISYYAEDGTEDAHGYFDQIVVGGTNENLITDVIGPEIRLFMNDTAFVFGGTTDQNPVLLALLKDEYGINTTGSGIGHDMVAVLNENTQQQIILNDYYESDLDSYNSGRVTYPFYDLPEGTHRLSLKVWDIFNNSSEAFLEFIVASSNDPVLKHVLNYPNPFTTYTEFWFEHNQPCCDLEVQIEVFTLSGKVVKTIHERVPTVGYRVAPISWDGLDDYGGRLARGVYVYRVSIKTDQNKRAEKYEKLVLLR